LISALLLLTLKHAHVGVNGKAILGVDLGSLYMKVALVQSGSPVQIVTNMHSKRKTEQMILFDRNGQRFYGADASSLLARKSQLTPAAMSVLLGRNADHPAVRVSRIILFCHTKLHQFTHLSRVCEIGKKKELRMLMSFTLDREKDGLLDWRPGLASRSSFLYF